MLLGAAPSWLADNAALTVVIALLALAAVVLWLVKQAATRLVLLAVIAAVALFAYANRGPLETCARTCECRIADVDIDVPRCTPDDGV